MLLVLCASTLGAGSAAAAPADRTRTEAELKRITEQLNELNQWFGSADRKRNQWQKELRDTDQRVAAMSAETDRAAAAVDTVRRELDRLQVEEERLQQQRATQARLIAEHVASAYRISGQDFIKLILNQQSPETFERMIRYHRHFSEARGETLDEYRATLAQLRHNRTAVEARSAELLERQRVLEAEQQSLLAQRGERRTLLARLESEVEDRTAERDRLEADRQRLATLLAELQQRAETLDGRAFAERRGSLPWPVAGRVQHGFGQPRADGRMAWHGLMVEVAEGTPIHAVFRGRVVFADWLRGYGLLTIIDHGSGYMTLYGHADALAKRVGDWVEGGEPIGRAGRSGGQNSSGLYFEVRQQGQARDPIAWLAKR